VRANQKSCVAGCVAIWSALHSIRCRDERRSQKRTDLQTWWWFKWWPCLVRLTCPSTRRPRSNFLSATTRAYLFVLLRSTLAQHAHRSKVFASCQQNAVTLRSEQQLESEAAYWTDRRARPSPSLSPHCSFSPRNADYNQTNQPQPNPSSARKHDGACLHSLSTYSPSAQRSCSSPCWLPPPPPVRCALGLIQRSSRGLPYRRVGGWCGGCRRKSAE